jgi:hypothetical protein
MADMICHKVYEFLMSILNIYKISNTSSFEINWGFFGGGQNFPPYKTLGWGPVSRCFLRPLRSLTSLAEPSNNSNL